MFSEKLDDKTFDILVKEAVKQIPVEHEEWTDHNIHDPGITFIELFAWLCEILIYRLNRISERNWRKFLKIMGINNLEPAYPAKVILTFKSKNEDTVIIPERTIVFAYDYNKNKEIYFETENEITVTGTEGTTVSARQQITVNDSVYTSNGLPDLTLQLEYYPVISNSIKLRIESILWVQREDFDASKPGDRHFVLDAAEGKILFGDGIRGKIPPIGKDNITIIEYRACDGKRGNLGAGSINRISGDLKDITEVNNERDATGGKDMETIEEAVLRVREELNTIHRAVTSSDYEQLVLNDDNLNVARTKALPGYHPVHVSGFPGIITLAVVPENKDENDLLFRKKIYGYLEKRRLLTTELFVIQPDYVKIFVKADVFIRINYLRDTVKNKINEELHKFLDPVAGGSDEQGWVFGRPVYLSEIYMVISGVTGVDYVRNLKLRNDKKEIWQDSDILIPEHALVVSGEHDITIR